MKAENMKLLDLQTGNYLELGEEGFFYGGKYIILMDAMKKEIYESFATAIQNKLEGIKYDPLSYKYTYSPHTSEPQGILKTLCDKTGAVIYGDRYVLLKNEECGNVYGFSWKSLVNRFVDFKNSEGNFSRLKTSFAEKFESRFLGNLFEEYSKQLRNEENKFDKLIEELK